MAATAAARLGRLALVCGLTLALGCPAPLQEPALQSPNLPDDQTGQTGQPGPTGQPGQPEPAEPVTDVAATGPASAPLRQAKLDTETLRLENTPDVPETMRERMNQYLETRDAGVTDISAKGDRLLVFTRFGETSQLHLVSTPMGARKQITFAREPVSSASFDPRDDNALVYGADIGGNEQHQYFRLDLATGRSTLLTDPSARNGELIWSRDGARVAYASNARNKKDFDIWVADGRDAASAERVIDLQGRWYPLDWSPDGKQLLVGEYRSINESQVALLDIAGKKLSRLSPEGQSAYSQALFAKNGTSVYAISDREGEFMELYETDLEGKAWRSLTRDIPWDVSDMALAGDGRTLAFIVNEGGFSALYVLDTRSRKHTRVQGVQKGTIYGLGFAKKANVLAFSVMAASRPSDAYTYDLRRKKLTRWTESEIGGLSAANLSEPTLIEYPTFDGRKIPAFYARPKGDGPFPVIIHIHGGPEGQLRPRFYSYHQYMLAESGIAILYPNVRGSSGYGKSYLLLDNGMKRKDSVKDIGALLDWIAQNPELDETRVGVLGGSYGGYMVLAALADYGDRIKAGVDVVGISNFVTFLENTADYRRDLRRAEYGDERDPEMRAYQQKISPANNVDKIGSALFVAQGANDPRVPATEAEQIVDAVRAAGHDVWYMLAKNEGHGFRKKENRDLYYLLTVMFFEKHLGVSGDK